MKLYLTEKSPGFLRPLCIATLAITVAACGGSNTADPDPDPDPDAGGVSNPDFIDVNGDEEFTAEDDWNFDGVVNQADIDAFEADMGIQTGGNGTPGPDGNIAPDCTAVDCISANAEWSDNALISQNRSPISTYALGIQRILYCLNYGGTEAGTTIADYADGIYGPTTAADVEAFQKAEGEAEDGIVGEKTWDALQAQLQGPNDFDAEFNDWRITSARPECTDQILFFQRKAAPMDWQQADVPGGLTKIPFSTSAN